MSKAAGRWRSELAAFIVGVLAIASSVVLGRPAWAASNECGPERPENYFVGAKAIEPPGGANSDVIQADLEARFPGLCTSTIQERFSVGSPMVYRETGMGWAQIGYARWTILCCFRFFWQWKLDSGSQNRSGFWGNPNEFTVYNFKVTRLSSDGHLHMLYLNPDSTPPCNQVGFCPETDFDPHQAWDYRLAEAFAEVNRPGSDIAGTDGTRADFKNILVRPQDQGWADPVGWVGDNDRICYFHRDTVTQYKHFRTWTDPLGHGTTC